MGAIDRAQNPNRYSANTAWPRLQLTTMLTAGNILIGSLGQLTFGSHWIATNLKVAKYLELVESECQSATTAPLCNGLAWQIWRCGGAYRPRTYIAGCAMDQWRPGNSQNVYFMPCYQQQKTEQITRCAPHMCCTKTEVRRTNRDTIAGIFFHNKLQVVKFFRYQNEAKTTKQSPHERVWANGMNRRFSRWTLKVNRIEKVWHDQIRGKARHSLKSQQQLDVDKYRRSEIDSCWKMPVQSRWISCKPIDDQLHRQSNVGSRTYGLVRSWERVLTT